jgi:hypothetical protein
MTIKTPLEFTLDDPAFSDEERGVDAFKARHLIDIELQDGVAVLKGPRSLLEPAEKSLSSVS